MGTVTAPAPWKQLLLTALESNAHLRHSSYFQLATIGSNGRPSNRTVVFRGFQEDSDKIQINTDCRTRKIEELKHCPFAEICWYFTDSWEQFRINGTVDIIDGSNSDPIKLQQREKSWFSGSLRSRLQYLGPSPGLPNLSEQPSNEVSLDPSTGPVGAFCLLVLDPHQVDYLNLKSNQRLSFTSTSSPNGEKSWTSERVNP
ncbi:pyridoxine/pyridoxamine 5'-phosphate oxidase 2 [Rosa sericea]